MAATPAWRRPYILTTHAHMRTHSPLCDGADQAGGQMDACIDPHLTTHAPTHACSPHLDRAVQADAHDEAARIAGTDGQRGDGQRVLTPVGHIRGMACTGWGVW
eukprot:108613-Chlamydomonas_euryale.AAC.4